MYSIRRVVWNVLLDKKGGVECTLNKKGAEECTPK